MPETEVLQTVTNDIYEGSELNLEVEYDGIEIGRFPYTFKFTLL